MKLNRNNYEEHFILYMDNELDGDGRREVEAFVKQNPDLKAELDLLMNSKLTPDAEISFTEKGSLMRFDSSSISLSNYEEWLTSYIDDELTEGERRDVEVFVAGNPAIQRELNLLQQAKLQPETIVFPYKESLYRKEEKARVVPVRWWRIAAAAVLLLGIGTATVVLINNRKDQVPDRTAKVEQKVEKSKTDDAVKSPGTESPVNEQIATGIKKEDNSKEPRNPISEVQPSKGNKQSDKGKNEPPSIAVITKQDMLPGNLIKSGDSSIVNGKTKPDNDVAYTDPNPLTKPIEKTNGSSVTTRPADSSISSDGSDNQTKNSDIVYAGQNDNNQKGGLRGFLRKVTRTIEKRTNIKATDDDDRLLVAGLAIKL